MDNEKEIRDLLEEEIKSEFEKLKTLTPGSKEHSEAVDGVVKLYKLNIEETENDRAFRLKCDESTNADFDLSLRQEQARDDRLNRYLRVGVEAAGVVLPLMFYGIWMKRGFKFEETGTFTSQTFKGLINKFRTR